MNHIFISYSRQDGAWVRALLTQLETRKLPTWIDQRDIPASLPWLSEVQDAIDEADLFLICDSPEFRESSNCAAELALAVKGAKPRFQVTVGQDAAVAAAHIAETLAGIDPRRRIRTSLRVQARDWDRAGRPRRALANRWQARWLRRATTIAPALTEAERTFLRASRTRANSRTAGVMALVLLTAVGVGVARGFIAAKNLVDSTNDRQAAAYATSLQQVAVARTDPYRGLAIAAGLSGDEAQVHALVVQAALHDPVPSDAFTVPAAATIFATTPVGSDVVITDRHGSYWGRKATAADTRSATPVAPPATHSVATPANVTVTPVPRTAQVQVHRGGQLNRIVTFTAAPHAITPSPNQRMIAAAVGDHVEIIDIRTGQIRSTLRGAPAPVIALAWSADGHRIWGLSPGHVISWPIGDTSTIADDPTVAYNSVLPARDPGAVWLVSEHTLTEVDAATGRVLATRTLDDTILSAAASPDGSLAAASGQNHQWIVDLAGTAAPRAYDVADCAPGRPSFRDQASFYLPCIGGELLTIATSTATIADKRTVGIGGVYGVKAMQSGETLVGDQSGHVLAVTDSDATSLFRSECRAAIARIALAPNGHAALAVGNGSGLGTCTRVALLNAGGEWDDTTSWTWNVVLEPPHASIVANAAVFDRDGAGFAIGYSDGTVILHPTKNVTPALTVDTLVGRVRDMLTLPTGDLIMVTDAGMAQRVAFCGGCLSNKELATVAADRLTRARNLGLTSETPTPGPTFAP
ncbi:toll/interleukin-1 receptor domain-containing protein [Catellatospora tritici]|uniref:toll/interleukin-1 receptor domain-containing protein n=1 Tax=Catellatospora tritici TaxID=2851566 RepID=UPI001C2D475B|nr:toll/interleukin-1 receptor domain-containing protein [Catellatospora tritici]MBV1855735.1 TIR domain-containing protein [Catellatospora tritici]